MFSSVRVNSKTRNAIIIQSCVRRWIVLNHFNKYEKNRIDNRYVIMKESLAESNIYFNKLYDTDILNGQLDATSKIFEGIIKDIYKTVFLLYLEF